MYPTHASDACLGLVTIDILDIAFPFPHLQRPKIIICFWLKNLRVFYVKMRVDILTNKSVFILHSSFKGIVSQDFEVCFLVPLDSSDIATP
jgi:hypothetical protein